MTLCLWAGWVWDWVCGLPMFPLVFRLWGFLFGVSVCPSDSPCAALPWRMGTGGPPGLRGSGRNDTRRLPAAVSKAPRACPPSSCPPRVET